MAKKLTDEQREQIVETGIREFADCGYDGANTNVIARKAGISVGVLFKYYKDKEGFFLACLGRSLDILRCTLNDVLSSGGNAHDKAERLFRTLIAFSREHGDHIRMYHMITAGSDKRLTEKLAAEIEQLSADVYSSYISAAQSDGEIRSDIRPELAAFFFDNLLMMLQFTYSCDYYKQRFLMYTGLEADDRSADGLIIDQLLAFTDAALKSRKND